MLDTKTFKDVKPGDVIYAINKISYDIEVYDVISNTLSKWGSSRFNLKNEKGEDIDIEFSSDLELFNGFKNVYTTDVKKCLNFLKQGYKDDKDIFITDIQIAEKGIKTCDENIEKINIVLNKINRDL